MLCHHQLHHAFIMQIIPHIDKYLVDNCFPTGYDFQSLAIGVKVILLIVVDRNRNVRISTEIFL